MCGIYAAVNNTPVVNELIKGLDSLSYRGYDSAGVAVFSGNHIERRRAQGKLECLANVLYNSPIDGNVGIAHTRWATHGLPNELNAHPHMTSKVAVVHNGIIENYKALRDFLTDADYHFESETDSEVIPLLLTYFLDRGLTAEQALKSTIHKLDGSFALVAIFQQSPYELYAARQGSPLVIGQSKTGFSISSDDNALPENTEASCHLQDGDLARITQQQLTITNFYGDDIKRSLIARQTQADVTEKAGYEHFMHKEMHEQPKVFKRTLKHYLQAIEVQGETHLSLKPLTKLTNKISRLTVVACGTSYYAGMVAKYWIEEFAGVPVDLDIASEYRYRKMPMNMQSAALFISQSGETADTLAALQHAKQAGQTCISIVNVTNSTMANESDLVLPILAGREIGVASTKAFTAQLAALMAVTLTLAKSNGLLTHQDEDRMLTELFSLDSVMTAVLAQENEIKAISKSLVSSDNALFMGRGIAFPLALEGALKLKEISYIHAEAYPAGELKHGPIALVDESMPVVVVAPNNELFAKTLSNLREVASRGARIILVSDSQGIAQASDFIEHAITLPKATDLMVPVIYNLPMQLLAYYASVLKGNDVDQPRNLAKSVTVE
ncbi:glutamine--fructose-6-phosphate transaminase (isomerizing) [Catenovulum sp. SM1970]|uniref:glutamine--fructose-6-phosphate transaminase (isomerizing) n=1 Tax=Marinifaba aquimaris TaxID=2741323 RepID=UPI001571ABAF|nr:glutamine--fructose-6-phosphate transaminase (isomerizing) [Marinifaba aquimaris]NTS76156.1 glutamine--fructose-6-phosphate transaminase (isomerizing) [Marinifaba aquimaris]